MNSIEKQSFCTTMKEGQTCPVCKGVTKYLYQPFKYFEFSVCSSCFDSVKTNGEEFYGKKKFSCHSARRTRTIRFVEK